MTETGRAAGLRWVAAFTGDKVTEAGQHVSNSPGWLADAGVKSRRTAGAGWHFA
jgi:hypothetical protein